VLDALADPRFGPPTAPMPPPRRCCCFHCASPFHGPDHALALVVLGDVIGTGRGLTAGLCAACLTDPAASVGAVLREHGMNLRPVHPEAGTA
jgi:hypothetical protein